MALVVKTRRVDDEHRPQGQQLHGFLHRVGGGAPGVGNDGQLLAGDGVDHAGLSGVAAAEKADVYPVGGGGGIQTHKDRSLKWCQKGQRITRPLMSTGFSIMPLSSMNCMVEVMAVISLSRMVMSKS